MTFIHLNSANPAAQVHFWCNILEGTQTAEGAQIPGAALVIVAQAPSGGTAGCSLDHLGLQVRDLAVMKQRLAEAGLPFDVNPNGMQVMATAPDGVRVELTGNPALATPAAFHHYHYYVKDIPAMQRWYAETLGAVPGKRAHFDAADLPGVNFTFSPSDVDREPTKGRALDHIGFYSDDAATLTDPAGTAILLRT